MKILALALVVANAAFFTWRYNEQVEAKIAAARPVAPLSGEVPSLTLVGELDELPPPRVPPKTTTPSRTSPAAPDTLPAEQAVTQAVGDAPADIPPAAASPPVAAVGTGAPSGVCVHIGPFATPAEYDSFRRWLAPRTTRLTLTSTTTAKRQLFWVYLEPATAAQAQADIAELVRKGVNDYLLINRNGLGNAISLGVFSSQDAVNRRLAEMTRKGYKPLVIPRIETTEMYWLDAEFATGYENADAIPADVRGNSGIEAMDCTKLATAEANAPS